MRPALLALLPMLSILKATLADEDAPYTPEDVTWFDPPENAKRPALRVGRTLSLEELGTLRCCDSERCCNLPGTIPMAEYPRDILDISWCNLAADHQQVEEWTLSEVLLFLERILPV